MKKKNKTLETPNLISPNSQAQTPNLITDVANQEQNYRIRILQKKKKKVGYKSLET